MPWLKFICNQYFDYLLAALLAVLAGGGTAYIAVRIRLMRMPLNKFLERVLTYSFIFTFLFFAVILMIISRTDPEFSPTARFRHSLRTIQSWFYPADPLLASGGLEAALALDTPWAQDLTTVFYTVGNQLYSVLPDGENRKLRCRVAGDIKQAIFSPDGKNLVLKTMDQIFVLSLKDDRLDLAYHQPPLESANQKKTVRIGGLQWSPDSQRLCFFVEKVSAVASQTSWLIYRVGAPEAKMIRLGPAQTVLLHWAQDSVRLYFSQASRKDGKDHSLWFEVPLETLQPVLKTKIVSDTEEVADETLRKHGIFLYHQDKRFRFESVAPLVRSSHVVSPSGRRLWINRRLQLCYESAYGVRFKLFGLSMLKDYLRYPPEQKQNELTLKEIRWLPSEEYALVRHYTHGLLVLSPIRRKIGILSEDVGIFGFYLK